jgi:hypothetical protein
MSKVKMIGTITAIESDKQFTKAGKVYEYSTIILDVDGDMIAGNYWKEDPIPAVGTKVNVVADISSHRNNKSPELFYHTINIHNVYEWSQRTTEEVHY